MNFTQIPDRLKYPKNMKGELSTLHSAVISYVADNYIQSYTFHKQVIGIINTLSLLKITESHIPEEWSPENPLKGLVLAGDDTCRESLGKLYVNVKDITWDLEESGDNSEISNVEKSPEVKTKINITKKDPVSEFVPTSSFTSNKPTAKKQNNVSSSSNTKKVKLTPKEDLYIQGPKVPMFDTSNKVVDTQIDGHRFVLYSSIPAIPTNQSEISCTTEVDRMTRTELLRLFPTQFVKTRAPRLYERIQGLSYDEELGVILKIDGFTEDQIRDNIIKYPHIFRLMKSTPDGVVSFYSTIEIDGELYNTSDIWKELSDTKDVPMMTEYMKEYVVRRYLLERDIKGINHRYKIYGTLNPFLTLFTCTDDYVRYGYGDLENLARECVKSRVSYKRTRNPILRRLNNV